MSGKVTKQGKTAPPLTTDHVCNSRCGDGLHFTLELLPAGTPPSEAEVMLQWAYRARRKAALRVEPAKSPRPDDDPQGAVGPQQPFYVWWRLWQ